jgi:hypothetical protein
MDPIPNLSEALLRLRAIFRRTPDVEFADTDLARLAGLDDDECRILLAVLEETGAIHRPRRRVFVCRASSWWTSVPVRSPASVPQDARSKTTVRARRLGRAVRLASVHESE